jgi:amino-acid N-acetyltransferase
MTRYAPYRIRPAAPADLGGVSALLTGASLPVEGVAEHFHSFLVAEFEGTIIGAMGLELYGDTALLRSAVVSPGRRKAGVGSLLFSRVLAFARMQGVKRLVLLTESAGDYFAGKGFRVIDAATVSGPVTRSVEFSGACPTHAVCMEMLV